jgi:hypothetical protein
VEKGHRGCCAPIDAVFACALFAHFDVIIFSIHGWWLLPTDKFAD